MSQVEIGKVMGMARGSVSQYMMLVDKIATEVLDLSKQHQEGRVAQNATNVAHNFTEGWFRNSGLYYLNHDNQLKFMEWLGTYLVCHFLTHERYLNPLKCPESASEPRGSTLRLKGIPRHGFFLH